MLQPVFATTYDLTQAAQTALENAEELLHEAQKALLPYHKMVNQALDWRMTLIESLYQIKPGRAEIGGWVCKYSPIGCCIYDADRDPARDSCVVCNEPQERK